MKQNDWPPMRYAVAGNYQQFVYACQQLLGCSPRDPSIRYIDEPQQLMGLEIRPVDEVLLIGTYYERKNWPQLHDWLIERQRRGEAKWTRL